MRLALVIVMYLICDGFAESMKANLKADTAAGGYDMAKVLDLSTVPTPQMSSNVAALQSDPARCAAGRYLEGSDCKDCPAGSITASPNTLTKCTPCLPGEYADRAGQSACDKCAIGSYSTGDGVKASCQPCGRGAIAPTVGATSCQSCQRSFVSDATGAKCVKGTVHVPLWMFAVYFGSMMSVAVLESIAHVVALQVLSEDSIRLSQLRQLSRRMKLVVMWVARAVLGCLWIMLLLNMVAYMGILFRPGSARNDKCEMCCPVGVLTLLVKVCAVGLDFYVNYKEWKGVESGGHKSVSMYFSENFQNIAELIGAVLIGIGSCSRMQGDDSSSNDFMLLSSVFVFYQVYLGFLYTASTTWEGGSFTIAGGAISIVIAIALGLHVFILPLGIFYMVQGLPKDVAYNPAEASFVGTVNGVYAILATGIAMVLTFMKGTFDTSESVKARVDAKIKAIGDWLVALRRAVAECPVGKPAPDSADLAVVTDALTAMYEDPDLWADACAVVSALGDMSDRVPTTDCTKPGAAEVAQAATEASPAEACLIVRSVHDTLKDRLATLHTEAKKLGNLAARGMGFAVLSALTGLYFGSIDTYVGAVNNLSAPKDEVGDHMQGLVGVVSVGGSILVILFGYLLHVGSSASAKVGLQPKASALCAHLNVITGGCPGGTFQNTGNANSCPTEKPCMPCYVDTVGVPCGGGRLYIGMAACKSLAHDHRTFDDVCIACPPDKYLKAAEWALAHCVPGSYFVGSAQCPFASTVAEACKACEIVRTCPAVNGQNSKYIGFEACAAEPLPREDLCVPETDPCSPSPAPADYHQVGPLFDTNNNPRISCNDIAFGETPRAVCIKHGASPLWLLVGCTKCTLPTSLSPSYDCSDYAKKGTAGHCTCAGTPKLATHVCNKGTGGGGGVLELSGCE